MAVVDRRTACVLEQGRALLGGLGILSARESQLHPAPPPPAPPAQASVPHPLSEPGPRADTAPAEVEPAAPEAVAAEPAEPAPEVEELPIPSYDTLSASQVVPRLASLEPDDLELIRRYEAAGRGRRTILNRVAQLQDV